MPLRIRFLWRSTRLDWSQGIGAERFAFALADPAGEGDMTHMIVVDEFVLWPMKDRGRAAIARMIAPTY
jgi:hypothetical protein